MPDEDERPDVPLENRESLEDRMHQMERDMEILREARRIAETVQSIPVVPLDPTGHFTGLAGLYKQFASFGVIGILSGLLIWVVIFEIPGARQKFVDVLLRIESDHREELVKEHEACRGDANLWRSHAQGLAADFNRQLDRTNSRMDLLAKQIIANQMEIMWTLQLYVPKGPASKKKEPAFIGPPTPAQDALTRLKKLAEALPFPLEVQVNE